MDNLVTVKIGGREIPLFYSTLELIEIERTLHCTGFQMRDMVLGYHLENEDDPGSAVFDLVKDPEKKEKLGKLIRILGNAGLEEEGKEPDLTDKWVMRHMRPAYILMYALAVNAVIADGNRMEAKSEKTGPVDEILEEENAKKQPGN